jgi:hypothetical protein
MRRIGTIKHMTERVGIFWQVEGLWVAAGCTLAEAVAYGDALTYDGGHAEHWDRWQEAGGRWLSAHDLPLAILTSEYDEHPRGRVVKTPDRFVIYADRRLLGSETVSEIVTLFGLEGAPMMCSPDSHYR